MMCGEVYNRSAIEHKASRVASTLGIDNGFAGLLDWVLSFRSDLGIPHTLAELDVNTTDRKAIALKAQADPSTSANPRIMTPEGMEEIFMAAVDGNLDLR